DILWSVSRAKLFATDNGPNTGFGSSSVSATVPAAGQENGPDPQFDDKLNYIVEGGFYGHPNRNRGRTDGRQNMFHSALSSPVFDVYTPPLVTSPPLASTDGIEEYRSHAFGGLMQGDFLLARLNADLYRVKLNAGGTSLIQFFPTLSNA